MPVDSLQGDLAPPRDELHSLDLDLALALDAARIGAWEWDPATDLMSCSRRMRTLCGISRDAAMTFGLFLTHIRREDRARTQTTLLQSFRDGAPRSVECRLTDSSAGTDRWIILEGRACAIAAATRRMLGTARDISGSKIVDAQRELAAQQLQHRLRNVFAAIASMVDFSERSASTPQQLAAALHPRLCALSRAHAALQEAGSAQRELTDIVEGVLAPFAGFASTSVGGMPVRLGLRQSAAFAAIMHELATNAVKYGALSRPGGRLAVDWSLAPAAVTDSLVLRWAEHCSHPIVQPTSSGMGLKLLVANARAVLRGDILLDFDSTGLTATLVAPICCLAETPHI